ncbi:MAG: IS200/IS605 family transposase [Bacteroidales bacterium]|jgi:REP element-mobilizing transposase RayT|nr:IS200/IS605 family transposase [Bacteroidales bacterium]
MPQTLSKVYVHITFSTKNRLPVIDDSIKTSLWEYIGGICKRLECNPIRIGGHNDHVHICCLLSKKISIMNLLEEIKKQSSKWIKTKSHQYSQFYWQDGYSIFSINPVELDIVVRYIDTQEEHHKKRTFKEELLAFLKKHKFEYDETYLWN